MARVQPRAPDRAGQPRPRATGARAPDRGARRRPLRRPELQPGHDDRRRAGARSRAATPARRVARRPWRPVAGGAPAGAARAAPRWHRDRRALPILLGLPPAEAVAVARPGTASARWAIVWVREVTAPRARRPGTGECSRRTTAPSRAIAGMPLETLRHGLRAPGAARRARPGGRSRRRGRLRLADGVARSSGFAPRVEGGDAEIDRVVRILEEAELSPPSLAELERQTGRRDVARHTPAGGPDRQGRGGRAGALLRPAGPGAVRRHAGRDRPWQPHRAGRAPRPPGDQPQVHDPLLEWADAKGITERVGDARRLRNA